MGLHQKITDRVTSEPCDCGADDDHGVDTTPLDEEQDVLNETSFEPEPEPEGVWTDGSE